MYSNGNDFYLESRVLAADPLELVRLLYQAATAAVREARGHLAAGDITARSRSISRACEILFELAGSLDFGRGGEIGRRLGELYDYMQRRLVEANMQQSDAPLAETLGLLATLAEAWEGVKPAESPEPPPSHNLWEPAMAPKSMSAYVPQSWSL